MTAVKVTWIDACSRLTEGRWSSMEDIRELSPVKATSYGEIVVDQPDFIVIAAHNAAEMAGGEICIPRVSIVSIVELDE
jgi:hypothetical protein